MIYKLLHNNLIIEQHEPHKKRWWTRVLCSTLIEGFNAVMLYQHIKFLFTPIW